MRRAKRQAKGPLQEAANLEAKVGGSKVSNDSGQIMTDERASDLSSESTNIDKLQIGPNPSKQRQEEAKPRNLLRNVQLWNKPSKRFKRAWKREPYPTSERFLAKQQKRRAHAEDQVKARANGTYSSKMKKKRYIYKPSI